jgi:dipeptidyl aminopeptidase/acylaminoacyl peptidase
LTVSKEVVLHDPTIHIPLKKTAAAAALVALFALTLWTPPALPQGAESFTPAHVAKIRSVTSARISPDGRHIAYTLSVPRRPLVDEDGAAWSELHVAGPGEAVRPFITGEVNVEAVRWTPDGENIAFLSRRGKDTTRALYLLPIGGGEARRVLKFDGSIGSYSFSPDGKRVAFTAAPPASKEKRELEGKGFNQDIYEEDDPPARVWIAALESESAPRMLDLPGHASAVEWSPTGGRLAVVLAPTPLVDDDYMYKRVHVIEIESGKVAARLENPGKLGQVRWNPDGSHIAMISGEDIHDPSAGRLLVAPASGGKLIDVIPGYLGDVASFEWKDAEAICYVGDEGVVSALGEVRRDGSDRRTILAAGARLPSSIDIARDSRTLAVIAESPQHPAETFRFTVGDKELKRLSDSNSWIASLRLAPQEVVRFKARDGLDLEGLLIRPLDEKPGTRYPLILTVHGGPEAHLRNGWLTSYSNPGQVAAARGFAVFYPNYRGSTGRGVAFSKLGQGDPAGREFDDLVDAVDHLVAVGLVDKAKVGITGGSYGGYASAWGATYYSSRFAASVAFVGISDKISKNGTTDIANEEYLVHALKRPWDAWDLMRERSPIYHAGKSRTPTLIAGGTDDPRVHPSQSLILYRFLKLHGQAPVRLVRYPGEQHGNRRAAARLDYHLRMLGWFEHYLKGPGGSPPPYEIDYQEALKEK